MHCINDDVELPIILSGGRWCRVVCGDCFCFEPERAWQMASMWRFFQLVSSGAIITLVWADNPELSVK